jgi:hypothetical protein
LLNADTQRAKVELAKHVSGIRMEPHTQGKKGHYIATGEWNLLGGYAEGLGHQESGEKRVRMVAGDCNAPNAAFNTVSSGTHSFCLMNRWFRPTISGRSKSAVQGVH